MPALTYDKQGNIIGTPPDLSPPAQSPPTGTDVIQSKIRNSAQHYGVDPNLALSIAKQESSFNPNATSKAGAVGVMQLMPETAQNYGITPEERTNPDKNIDAGMRYLADLQKKHGGDKAKMLIEYNSGPKNVDKDFNDLPEETQGYLTNILGPNAKSQSGPTVYDKNGNIIGSDISKSPVAPSPLTPQQRAGIGVTQAEQTYPRANVPGASYAKEAAPYAPLVLGGVGGYLGGLAGLPNVGAGIGEGLGDIYKGVVTEGGMNPDIAKEAFRNAALTAGTGKAIDLAIPYVSKALNLKKYLANRAANKSANLLEEQRKEITGGIPSGSTAGQQLELEAKNAPVEQEKNEAWKKVYDRTDQAQKTLDVLTGETNPTTGQPVTIPKTIAGPIKLSKDTFNFINQEKQRLEANIKAGIQLSPRDAKTYQMLNKLSQGVTQDKSGDIYTDFDSAKQLRTLIGKTATQERGISVQAPGQRIGLQRGTGIQSGLRDKLNDDITNSLYDIGGSDAVNEYANAVGMTKKAAKANIFDKVIARNTDQATGNLNIDAAMNDFLKPTSKDGRQFTADERQNIRNTLLELKKTSGFNGGLQFQNGRIIFNSVLAMGHPWRAAIAAKDLFERGMSDPKYARIIPQLPAAPANSTQARTMTRSFFKGAMKSVPVELIAPSGMRVSAHIDENGEPKPDFQMSGQ